MNIDFLNGFAAAFPIMAFSMFLLLRSQEKMFSDMLDMQNAEVEELRRMRAALRKQWLTPEDMVLTVAGGA